MNSTNLKYGYFVSTIKSSYGKAIIQGDWDG